MLSGTQSTLVKAAGSLIIEYQEKLLFVSEPERQRLLKTGGENSGEPG